MRLGHSCGCVLVLVLVLCCVVLCYVRQSVLVHEVIEFGEERVDFSMGNGLVESAFCASVANHSSLTVSLPTGEGLVVVVSAVVIHQDHHTLSLRNSTRKLHFHLSNQLE